MSYKPDLRSESCFVLVFTSFRPRDGLGMTCSDLAG